MKGYKAFDENLKCNHFQYEIGQTYEMDGDIECCARGFHFCKELVDCYRFYEMSDNTRICKVEAIGEIKTNDNIKYCTNKIKILSEVKNPRIKSSINKLSSGYCNSGYRNSGNKNSGNCNSGNMNSGNKNSGNKNSGDFNGGYRNSGDSNNGNCNSGDRNNGDWNSGNMNSGNWNSGDWNSGNYNIGVFNCDTEPKIKMFDKDSDWTMNDWQDSDAFEVMLKCPCYINYYDNDQKKSIVHKETARDKQKWWEETARNRQKWWDELSEDDKNAVKSLPNFDADKFYLCTGIRV
jgi:hypothetical protein